MTRADDSMRRAQAAYDAAEPPETPSIVRVTPATTLGALEEMIADHGIRRITLALTRHLAMASAETIDADGDGGCSVHRDGWLATVIGDAISAAVVAQREMDAAVGS